MESLLLLFPLLVLLQYAAQLASRCKWLTVGSVVSVVGADALSRALPWDDGSCDVVAGLAVPHSAEAEPSSRGAAELALVLYVLGSVRLAGLALVSLLEAVAVDAQDVFGVDLDLVPGFSLAVPPSTAEDCRASVALIHRKLEDCVLLLVVVELLSLLIVFLVEELFPLSDVVAVVVNSQLELLLLSNLLLYQVAGGSLHLNTASRAVQIAESDSVAVVLLGEESFNASLMEQVLAVQLNSWSLAE